ncbi:uncharacterized protein N7459_008153 [Penicillium hispanicum]|uniref:uncharacterized protein n=1 Tax=Penicillium hispanicum TaxID=1080232 RepID=UPI00254130C4|nr:uncharacterized protein N7459_008153 [Penicillium hispanicum]KAJ5573726.1 hypothetical protein N7459_008153 [Penicillium hispanicum]
MAADLRSKALRDLMRNNGFLVNPLQWTSRHLDMVGCRFENVDITPVCTVSTPDDRRADPVGNTCPKSPSNAEILARNPFPNVKSRCLVAILVGEERAFEYPRGMTDGLAAAKELVFIFKVGLSTEQTVTFHRHGQPIDHIHSGSPAVVGYAFYPHIIGDRRNQFEPCPGPRGTINRVGVSIRQKRLAQIVPKEWTEDPYFVCLLLALAQLQEGKVKLSKPVSYIVRISLSRSAWPQLICFQSRLLVTHRISDQYIHLYEAEITAELLNALKDPNNATNPIEWPTIRWRKLPFEPFDTFDNRLVAELVAPSPFRSRHPSAPSDDVNSDIMSHDMKRQHEQTGSMTCKKRRIS